MARTGMANPIVELRNLGQAGTADFTMGTVNYWSDDHLQAILDRNRTDVIMEQLKSEPTEDGSGTVKYYDYYCKPGWYEEGTATFRVTTSMGSAVSPSEINYQMGHISFGLTNQAGTVYYLTARKYDMNAAAAQVWRVKAANVASAYDFSADGQSMSRSQMQRHFLQMATMYDAMSEPRIVTMYRSDN